LTIWVKDEDVSYLELERVTGIEPAFSAWEADVLPLNYTRIAAVVRKLESNETVDRPMDLMANL
tara:strand:- start:66 stop:257 length:192 start_codon:yes stop_codon:yes gene_type:complete